ncbi:hypothetical protein KGF54_001944 [Candida jiufengensis]|uniref:uncharacterized protein n=1 Tax=Candida jiufengensis TaxID=497108 RepID=UPI002224C7C2|nr:uncharacterized protein KGF54_001944 [Candida jiufengensis]KAI5955383.1 hypothetical protein KGF54_001944 [Candida jiufengensis]
MEVVYSTSNILGYKSGLPELEVTLPLKYPPTSSSTTITNPNDQFHQQTAVSGSFINLESNSLISIISCSILNDLKTIDLTPIEYKRNNLGIRFQNIKIQLPNTIASTTSLSIIRKGENIDLNIIDSKYLFITLQISIESFIQGRTLNLSDFEKWGHISVPYSFELRSSPYIIKSLDELNTIVSLKDGGLLHFQRNEPLSDVKIHTFNEPISFFSGFFGSDKKKELNGISSNSIVDVLQINELLVTLTASKELKLWNLQSRQYLSTTSLFNKKAGETWLTTIPTKYLKLINANGEFFITMFITTNSGDSKKSRFAFKTFKLDNTSLTEQEQFDLQPELPNTLLSSSDVYYHDSTFQNNIWFIQDYEVEYIGKEVLYNILWKSNTSSILVSYRINFDNGSIIEIKASSPNSQVENNELSAYHESDYYIRKIFDSGFYNELIVSTSLSILVSHLNREFGHINTNLRESATTLISSNSDSDPKYLWFKLYSLCEEFRKLSNEALAITSSNNGYITLNANGFGMFRPSHYFESFMHKALSSPDGELIQIFNKFKSALSSKSYHKLYSEILSIQNGFDSEKVNEVFTSILGNKLTDEEINSILNDLSKISDVLEIVHSLVSSSDFQLINELDNVRKLGDFFQDSTFVTFRNIIQQHTAILLDLVILFLICESNDEILRLLNSVVTTLQRYNTLDIIMDTSITAASSGDRGISKINNSLFWSAIVDKDANLDNLIKHSQINDAYDYFFNDILSKDEFIINSVMQLINNKQGQYLQRYFLNKLSRSSAEELFLIGIISLINNEPEIFFETFVNFEKFDNLNIRSIFDLKKNENLRPLLTVLSDEPTKSGYYHELSKLLLTQISNKNSIESNNKLIENSLKFEDLAIKSTDVDDLKEEYYLNVFHNALNISDYNLVQDALVNLSNSSNIKQLFKEFVTKLIQQHKCNLIFPSTNSNTKLYREHFKLIDTIINQIANDTSLNQSLKIYEILFSWRNFGCSTTTNELSGDKRGSCEALYQFIWRYKMEFKNQIFEQDNKIKLKILELYIIILNVLKTFEVEDRWILVQKNDSREILSINNLQKEYFDWLKTID